jgi:hypothetical protein
MRLEPRPQYMYNNIYIYIYINHDEYTNKHIIKYINIYFFLKKHININIYFKNNIYIIYDIITYIKITYMICYNTIKKQYIYIYNDKI